MPKDKQPKVVVAMSGGVDSSIAAALLVEQGYEVIGMMLRLWSEPGRETENRCCTPDSMAQAKKVRKQKILEIIENKKDAALQDMAIDDLKKLLEE